MKEDGKRVGEGVTKKQTRRRNDTHQTCTPQSKRRERKKGLTSLPFPTPPFFDITTALFKKKKKQILVVCFCREKKRTASGDESTHKNGKSLFFGGWEEDTSLRSGRRS